MSDATESLLTVGSIILWVITLPFSLLFSLKLVQDYERVVIFRFGRVEGDPKGPGIFFVLPCLDKIQVVDLRNPTYKIDPQEIRTKDLVTLTVNAVVYHIDNVKGVAARSQYADKSSEHLVVETIRKMLSVKDLSQVLSDREQICRKLFLISDDTSLPKGFKIEQININEENV